MGTKALLRCEGGDNQALERTFYIRISMGIYDIPQSIYPLIIPFLSWHASTCSSGFDRMDHVVTLCSIFYGVSQDSPLSFTNQHVNSIRDQHLWLGFLHIQSSIKLQVELLAKCNVALVVATVLISEAMSLDAAFSRRYDP